MAREKWSIEKLQAAANEYGNRTEFARGNSAAYSTAARRGVLDDICGHMISKKAARYTDDELRVAASQFDNMSDFRAAMPSHVQAIYSRGLSKDFCSHMSPRKFTFPNRGPNALKWTDDRLKDVAAPYTDRSLFKKEQTRAYDSARERGLLENVCSHMEITRPARMTTELYTSSLPSTIKVLEEVTSCTKRYRHECTTCSHEWMSKPNWIRSGRGCPKCSISQISKDETELGDWIETLGFSIERNNRSLIAPWEIDINVQFHNVAVEFNGMYWHSLQPREYHLNKTKMCATQGVRLLHVWEHEARSPIMRSIIASSLGVYDRKIRASKCSVKPIGWATCRDFLNDNHIQGAGSPTPINFGLYDDDTLVAVMTFANPRFKPARQDFELVRFATAINTRVFGAASKMWQHRPNGSIISYSDNRLFTGEMYGSLGFVKDHTGEPGYFYVRNSGETMSRFQAQKHKLAQLLGDKFDANESEAVNMKRAGWNRIWDCGSTRWVHDPKKRPGS